MVFYAAKIMRDARMSNPTLVFITDRNDLDDQLFGEVFAPASILPETPVRADSVRPADAAQPAPAGSSSPRFRSSRPRRGGDANPVLTDRRNVVVVADEAHRSQYGFSETLTTDGTLQSGSPSTCATRCPTPPISASPARRSSRRDKSTRAVFGDYIDVYDLTRAVEDGATVRIFYESRLAKVQLADEALRDARRSSPTKSPRQVEEDEARQGQVEVGPAGGHRRCRRAARPDRRRHRRSLGEAPGRAVRQGA